MKLSALLDTLNDLHGITELLFSWAGLQIQASVALTLQFPNLLVPQKESEGLKL